MRATDFVREFLGIKMDRARWLVRLGRGLRAVPELDRALVKGKINASQAVALSRILSAAIPPEECLSWIEHAAGQTVRALRKDVRAELRRRRRQGAVTPGEGSAVDDGTDGKEGAGGAAGTRDGFEAGATAPGNSDQAEHAGSDPADCADCADNTGNVEIIDLDADPDDSPPGGWMSIPVPARVAELSQEAFELSRRAAGRQLSPGQCAELIFAEYLSAVGDEDPAETARVEREFGGEQRARRLQEVIRALSRQHYTNPPPPIEVVPDDAVTAPRERKWPEVEWAIPSGALPEECRIDRLIDSPDGASPGRVDPWQLAEALRRLTLLKAELRFDLAGMLDRVHHDHVWFELGFNTFDEYCEERLGFGRRRAERLIRFRVGLGRFKRLKRAYLTGRISYTAVLLLLRILSRSTEKAWVKWADGVIYRELERVVEYAVAYMLPHANPAVLESYARALMAQEAPGAGDDPLHRLDATAFPLPEVDDDVDDQLNSTDSPHDSSASNHSSAGLAFSLRPIPGIPFGCALPPARVGGLPIISGLPDDLTFAPPELCIARVRFWASAEVLELAYRALRRCRLQMSDPLRATWAYFEVILAHFIIAQDTPAAREIMRRHKIIDRDGFRCTCGGCTSRANLHTHHLEHLAQGGSDEGSNLTTVCAGHHLAGLHRGVIEMGGRAPDRLITRLGINPRTGKALLCYLNDRRVSDEQATRELAEWRRGLREADSTGPTARRQAIEGRPSRQEPRRRAAGESG